MAWTPDSLEDLARALLAEAGIAEPPVDVERLAHGLGVARIAPARLDREIGRLELRDSEFVISVDRDTGSARRRFTIAHEVAHLVLADPRLDLRSLRRQPGLDSEERFCDRLAETLLMPADWVSERYSGRAQELRTLFECAKEFRTSAAATTVRLQRTLGWSRSLLRFRAWRKEWALLAITAWRGEARSAVRATSATGAVLSGFALPGTESRLWLPLHAGGRSWAFGTELCGRDGWAFALVNPARRRPYAAPSGRVAISPRPALKLFYALDDLDACIMARENELEGKDERSDRRSSTLAAIHA